MQELVDIIDENGKVLYSRTKKEAHELGLLHKTTVAKIIDTKGHWLLIKQSAGKQDVGKYVCPVGGHVMSGESDDDAIKREVAEEVGFTNIENYKLLGKKIFNRNVLGKQENHMFIMYEIVSDQKPVLNHESESFKYFTASELKSELKENPQNFGVAFHFAVSSFFLELM